jgi:hypothetical protein
VESPSREPSDTNLQFYKSRYLTNPTVYVQETSGWRSFAPGGIITQHAGEIPETIKQAVEPIPADEAQPLLALLHADLHQLGLRRALPASQPKLSRREWRQLLYAAIVGLIEHLLIAAALTSLFMGPSDVVGTGMAVLANFIGFFSASLIFALLSPRVSSSWHPVLFAVGLVVVNVITGIAQGDLAALNLVVFGTYIPAFYGFMAGRLARLISKGLQRTGSEPMSATVKPWHVGAALSAALVIFSVLTIVGRV